MGNGPGHHVNESEPVMSNHHHNARPQPWRRAVDVLAAYLMCITFGALIGATAWLLDWSATLWGMIL